MNHDIKYKGKVYHVQTEDSGLKNPVIKTIIFIGGTILGSKKTTYEDILKSDQRDKVVRELMEEQHKSLVRELLSGRFENGPVGDLSAGGPKPAPKPTAKPAATAPAPTPATAPAPPKAEAETPTAVAPTPGAPKQEAPKPAATEKKEELAENQSIDDIIMEHLSLDD